MSTNEELVQRAETVAQQVAQNKTEIEAMVRKLDEVQAPSIASSKEDIRQAIIEKGQEVDTSVPFSEYGNKIRKIEVSENIPESIPSITDNIVTIPVGKISENKEITVGTAKSAKTYTPSTKNQTIAKDTYLTGVQTIKGDANLIEQNIKSGVSIFNVSGTFTSDATATASDIAKGKTAYVNGYMVTGTSTGVGGGTVEDDNEPLLVMHFNDNLDIQGKCSTGLARSKEFWNMDYTTSTWTPSYDEGVFGGRCLSLPSPTEEEEEYGEYSYKWVDLPVTSKYVDNDFTVEFWFKPVDGRPFKFHFFRIDSSRRVTASLSDGINTMTIMSNGKVLESNVWSHIALVKNNGNIMFFINGELQPLYNNGSKVWDIKCQQEYTLAIGDSDAFYVGFLDELKIIQKALYTEDFTPPTSEYNDYDKKPQVIVDVPLKEDFTSKPTLISSGVQIGERGGKKCAIFSESNKSVIYNNKTQLTGKYTVSFWVYPDNTNSCDLCDLGDAGDITSGIRITYGDGKINLYVREASSGFDIINNSIPLNQWSHICVVHNVGISWTNSTSLYINGVNCLKNYVLQHLYQRARLWIGRSENAYTSSFNGGIRDFKAFDTLFTEQEVLDLYNKGLQ